VPAPDPSSAQVREDARWILQTVRPDGAIATNPDRRLIWPYLANYATAGLARAAAAGDASAAAAGWRWLEWYQAHEDGNGYVTDYHDNGAGIGSDGKMDSTDAYAGTFLVAVRDMFAATADRARLAGLRAGIDGAVRAIESTMDADGLTFAKPSWRVKYLMDNAEAYGGLLAAAQVARVLGDAALTQRSTIDAQRVHDATAKLWNPASQSFDWAVHGATGAHQGTDWSVLYPDTMQQAWAVAWGLTSPAQTAQIMGNIERYQPHWADPNASARYESGSAPVGYWAVAAWALQRSGVDPAVAVRSMRGASIASSRAWPFTSATQGQLIVAEAPPLRAVGSP
jgi:hypothetical protein